MFYPESFSLGLHDVDISGVDCSLALKRDLDFVGDQILLDEVTSSQENSKQSDGWEDIKPRVGMINLRQIISIYTFTFKRRVASRASWSTFTSSSILIWANEHSSFSSYLHCLVCWAESKILMILNDSWVNAVPWHEFSPTRRARGVTNSIIHTIATSTHGTTCSVRNWAGWACNWAIKEHTGLSHAQGRNKETNKNCFHVSNILWR